MEHKMEREDMKIEEIKRTTVIGAGGMGAQIADVLSRIGGYEVWMVDISDELVRKGFGPLRIGWSDSLLRIGKLTPEEKKNIVNRIKGSTSIEEASKKG